MRGLIGLFLLVVEAPADTEGDGMGRTYAEKLKDPRWQKKRLEILERDEWKCSLCDDESETLHVHHVNYEPRRDPWNYDDDNFVSICETCHESVENVIRWFRRVVVNRRFFENRLALGRILYLGVNNEEFGDGMIRLLRIVDGKGVSALEKVVDASSDVWHAAVDWAEGKSVPAIDDDKK